MIAWFRRHYNVILQIMLLTLMISLVVLLAWGITTSDLLLTMMVGGGLALTIVIVGTSTIVPDNLRSQATERTLRLASSTQSVMRGGLTAQSCRRVCQLLMPEMRADAIAMTDASVTMAHVGEPFPHSLAGEPISAPTQVVLDSGSMQTFANIYQDEWVSGPSDADEDDADDTVGISWREQMRAHPAGIIVPLIVADQAVGTIKFYYNSSRRIDRTQLAMARGFSELISTQLSTYALDRQAELTAQAEVKALQAQINPHFLFNALNTIASFTRIDPTKARNLLREFSSFYRYTLQSSRSLVPLSSELEQVRRYLQIEKARFGEDRIVEAEVVEPGCESIQIPGFLIQPIVENSVRHGLRDEGALHIDIQAVTDGDDVMISVADDGLGMSEEVAARLAAVAQGLAEPADSPALNPDGTPRGAGIALSNVADRLEHFFGVGSGVEVISRPGEGTVVTLRLVNAAPFDRRLNPKLIRTDTSD